MKKSLIGILALISFSSFALEVNNVDIGYGQYVNIDNVKTEQRFSQGIVDIRRKSDSQFLVNGYTKSLYQEITLAIDVYSKNAELERVTLRDDADDDLGHEILSFSYINKDGKLIEVKKNK
ncbi:MAG: hypothetical protein ACOVP4_01535 [Bacteriovoracaceae bacterium]